MIHLYIRNIKIYKKTSIVLGTKDISFVLIKNKKHK